MSRARIRRGDIFAVPLGEKGFGYVQYVADHPLRGPLLRVFSLVTDGPLAGTDQLAIALEAFGPVYSSFWPAVKTGAWPFVGNIKVPEFQLPTMIDGHFGDRTKRMHAWFLVHPDRDEYIGEFLPKEYRDLEFAMIWSPDSVEHRMATGHWPAKSVFWLPFEDPPDADN